MKNNVVITTTDKKLEQYAIPMVQSFKKFNPNIAMYCIITDDVDKYIQSGLKHLGVTLLKYKPELTTHVKHTSLVIPNYVPEFNKVMWLDIDMLIQDNLLNLFNHFVDITGHGGFDGKNWIEKTKSGKPYLTTAILVMPYFVSCELSNLYKLFGEQTNSDGEFLRKHLDEFDIRQLNPRIYSFCNTMIDKAEYDGDKITYKLEDKQYTPKIIHFSKHYSGRCRSTAIDRWCLDNGIQLRHS